MTNVNTAQFLTEDEIRNNADHNQRFLKKAEKELKQLKDTKGYITDGDIAKVLGIK